MLDDSRLILDEIGKLVRHSHAVETTYVTSMTLGCMRIRKLRNGLLLHGHLFGNDFSLLLLLKLLLLHLGYCLHIKIGGHSILLNETLVSFWELTALFHDGFDLIKIFREML